ncbi:hypothetical protein CBG25_03415 [Arsenophonus sp. ENCA]|nr:hypothetical protein CBG25_03415 [Arsenophonus sp. ENCA]
MIASVILNYGKQTGYIKYAIYSLPIRYHNPAIQKRTLFFSGAFIFCYWYLFMTNHKKTAQNRLQAVLQAFLS